MKDPWKPVAFNTSQHINGIDYVLKVSGFTYNGVGMHDLEQVHRDYGETGTWTLTHLATGGAICCWHFPERNLERFIEFATRVASATDWTAFDDPAGWRNVCPDLPQRVRALVAEYEELGAQMGSGHPIPKTISGDAARMVREASEGQDG